MSKPSVIQAVQGSTPHGDWLFMSSAKCGTQEGLRAGALTFETKVVLNRTLAWWIYVYLDCASARRHNCEGAAQRRGPAKQDLGHPHIPCAAARGDLLGGRPGASTLFRPSPLPGECAETSAERNSRVHLYLAHVTHLCVGIYMQRGCVASPYQSSTRQSNYAERKYLQRSRLDVMPSTFCRQYYAVRTFPPSCIT